MSLHESEGRCVFLFFLFFLLMSHCFAVSLGRLTYLPTRVYSDSLIHYKQFLRMCMYVY